MRVLDKPTQYLRRLVDNVVVSVLDVYFVETVRGKLFTRRFPLQVLPTAPLAFISIGFLRFLFGFCCKYSVASGQAFGAMVIPAEVTRVVCNLVSGILRAAP